MKLNGKEKTRTPEESESRYYKARNERDMLNGNMNRMFVSDDIDEIIEMYLVAKYRLSLIYHYCLKMCDERGKSNAE